MCKYVLVLTRCAPGFMTKSVTMLPIVLYFIFNKNPLIYSFYRISSCEKLHVESATAKKHHLPKYPRQ